MSNSNLPFMRYYFKTASLNFDLQSFEFERSSENSYQKEQYLLSMSQIYQLEDSVYLEKKKRSSSLNSYLINSFSGLKENNN